MRVSRCARAVAVLGAVAATASAFGCGRVESLGPARTTSVEARPAGGTDTEGATDTAGTGLPAATSSGERPPRTFD